MESRKLEEVQLEGMHIVLGAKRGTNHQSMYDILGWETLINRRTRNRLHTLHKIIHNPNSPLSYLVKLNDNQNTYNLGVQPTFKIPLCSTNIYNDSFFPDTIKLWTELPDNLRKIH